MYCTEVRLSHLMFYGLQKKPLYMLPSLGCGLICIIFFLLLGTVRCVKIVIAVEEYGLTYFAMFCIFNW